MNEGCVMDKLKDLETFCKMHNRLELIEEWDYDKNKDMSIIPSKIKYNSPREIWWKCKYGHNYCRSIISRTQFNMGCQYCDLKNISLPIGTKYGCLTIIDGFSAYNNEVATEKIAQLEKEKQDFLDGKKSSTNNFDSIETFDEWIQNYKSKELYKCQCKCGKIYFLDEFSFLMKKHRYCNENCGIKQKHDKDILDTYERIKDESYDINFSGTVHESLEILECINDKYEKLYSYTDKRKRGGGTYKLYKIYKCRCYLCGKEYEFMSSEFKIKNDSYGINATKGYYSNAYCDCHTISSFQWRTINIFKEYNINYKVEVSFEDLIGVGNKNLLRYDFAIFDDDNNIKCFIECQGEQHYKPVKEFGGKFQYNLQMENDQLKRDYANKRKIPMIEIPYTCNTYEKEEEFLKSNKII